jgi:hypothetical protein
MGLTQLIRARLPVPEDFWLLLLKKPIGGQDWPPGQHDRTGEFRFLIIALLTENSEVVKVL